MITSFKLRLAVLAVGLAVPTAAFSFEGGTREVPAKEIPVPTAGVSPPEQTQVGAPLRRSGTIIPRMRLSGRR